MIGSFLIIEVGAAGTLLLAESCMPTPSLVRRKREWPRSEWHSSSW